jgi:hypothetical protein
MSIERLRQMFLEGYITANVWVSFKDGRKPYVLKNCTISSARNYREWFYREGKEIRVYHPDYDEPLFSEKL